MVTGVRNFLKLSSEVNYFIFLGFDCPDTLTNSLTKNEKATRNKRVLELLVHEYNKTVSSVSKEERMLFQNSAESIEDYITKGVTKITWNNPKLEEYISESRTCCEELKEVFGTYKIINSDLMKICEKIKQLSFFLPNENVMSVEDFEKNQKSFADSQSKTLSELLIEIQEKIHQVFELTKLEPTNLTPYWSGYYKKWHDFLMQSLLFVIKKDSEVITECFSFNKSLFQGSLKIVDNQVKINPDKVALEKLVLKLEEGRNYISKICQENDIILEVPENLKQVWTTIREVIKESLRDGDTYCQLWQKFNYLWDTSVLASELVLKSESLIDTKINIQTFPDVKQIGLLIVDVTSLKVYILNLINNKIGALN